MTSTELMKKVDSGIRVAFYEFYHDPENPLNIIRDVIDALRNDAEVEEEGK